MLIPEMFLKIVEEINEDYMDKYENLDDNYTYHLLQYQTDGNSSAVYYRGEVLFFDEEYCWNGEEEGNPRFGRSEYDCLKEDVYNRLQETHLALGKILVILGDMRKNK